MKLTINVDLDGVVYDFNNAMHVYAELALQRKLPPTDTWNMWEAWGIEKTEFYTLFNEAIVGGYGLFNCGIPIDGAQEALHRLAKAGHRLRIVTAKRLRHKEATKQAQRQVISWLHRVDLLHLVEVVFTADKQGYVADVVIDDKPTLQWVQPKALNILFDQPWNREVETPKSLSPSGIVVRGHSWRDVEDLINVSQGVLDV